MILKEPGVVAAIQVWQRWKRYGWPYLGGWAEQPCRVFDAVNVCESEWTMVEERRMEKIRDSHR